MPCHCGSQQEFKHCCQPFILGAQLPETAEELMRSRFSAYVIKNAHYIAKTYATSKQSENSELDIKTWADQTTWIKLDVVNTNYLDTSQHYVEFKAYYIHENTYLVLHERSRFIYEENTWRYIDGDILSHEELKKLTRNTHCPCNSGKKYKRCCLIAL